MFVFQEEGDKYNRQRLRNFEGFTFQTDSEEYEGKIQWVQQTLTLADLTAVCSIIITN
jgi:hypothetical protein